METVHEEWRPIPGTTGYECSNLGMIRSLTRMVRRRGPDGVVRDYSWKGRMLVLAPHKGYLVTKLGAQTKMVGAHQLIALTWIGPRPEGMVVNHINGNKEDNRPENLEYVTNSENVHHAYRTGLLSNKGETNGISILTNEQAREIRERHSRGESKEQLAKEFGVRKYIIYRIVRGQTYSAA